MIKRRFPWALVGAAALMCVSMTLTARTPGVQFSSNIKQGMAQAGKQKKLVMIDFYTDWCGFCKMLDKNVYSNSRVGAAVRKSFVALKVNPEKDPLAAAIVQSHGIDGYPTILIVDAKGREVHRIVGYTPVPAFLKELNTAQLKARKLAQR